MTNFIVIASLDHPLYDKLKSSSSIFYTYEDHDFDMSKEIRGLDKKTPLFEFTLLSRREKVSWVKSIDDLGFPYFLEGSCLSGDNLLKETENCQGIHSTAFKGPTNKIETFFINDHAKDQASRFFETLHLEVYPVEGPGIGFTYPRVISMIINEAYFAIEDQLAERESIDTAMKYGVNYPKGPFEWKENIGAKPIVKLLDELYYMTGEERYNVCTKLREEAL